MKEILAIFKKEFKTQIRYKIIWINLSLTPFFIIAPYVFTARGIQHNLQGDVITGCFIWFWLNQYFFGLGDAFRDERESGTLVSIIVSPISMINFLIGKGLWLYVNCIYITIVTMTIFAAMGVNEAISIKMFVIYLVSGIYLFCFSIFFSALVLNFKKLSSVNSMIQEGIGILSGMTVKINNYPKLIQGIANFIPLTFAIKLGRQVLNGATFKDMYSTLLILSILSIIYFFIGTIVLNTVENSLRKTGDFEKW